MLRAFRGRLPVVHPTAFVDDSAQIIGDVEIGRESSVWMNVVVRGDVHVIRIGERTNVQDAAVVHAQRHTHPTYIGDEVTVGHAAILHGCTIGHRVLVGMGAILLNGAAVADECIVAAGSLVTEGFVAPPRSLIMGHPARVTRSLTDDEAASIGEYAARYVSYRLDYFTPFAASER